MKTAELRELSVEELEKKLAESERDAAELTFKHALGQLENPISIRHLRKDIARINTVMTEKSN